MVTNTPINIAPDPAFGLCPECHQLPALVNFTDAQIAVCHDHKVAWQVCRFVDDAAETLGDPDEVAEYGRVEPFFADKDMHDCMKARRARMGRRLGKRAQ